MFLLEGRNREDWPKREEEGKDLKCSDYSKSHAGLRNSNRIKWVSCQSARGEFGPSISFSSLTSVAPKWSRSTLARPNHLAACDSLASTCTTFTCAIIGWVNGITKRISALKSKFKKFNYCFLRSQILYAISIV